MTNELNLTRNELAAALCLLNDCLAGMGGSVPEDLHDDPYTWCDVDTLVANGWPMKQAQGVFGSLTAKGIVFEADKGEYSLDGWEQLIDAWHAGTVRPVYDAQQADEAPAQAPAADDAAEDVARAYGMFRNQTKSMVAALRLAAARAMSDHNMASGEFVKAITGTWTAINPTTVRCAYAQAKRGE